MRLLECGIVREDALSVALGEHGRGHVGERHFVPGNLHLEPSSIIGGLPLAADDAFHRLLLKDNLRRLLLRHDVRVILLVASLLLLLLLL